MNRLNLQERARIIGCLVEGNSIRATARMTDTDKKTVLKLLADIGAACKEFHDQRVRNVNSRRVECDEIWSFCYAKERNVPPEHRGEFGFGDVWTWTALCAESKLMIGYRIGGRSADDALPFMEDLRSRLADRVQLTTDGHHAYLEAVSKVFEGDVDYAMLQKIYDTPSGNSNQHRYSPGFVRGTKRKRMSGNPSKKHISTSYVERQNLSMRMGMRRFTRLTNAFSKKVENHCHAIALYFMHYNFGRIHQTLRVTPAMEAGLTDHVWTLEEIAGLTEKAEIREAVTN